MTSRTNATPTPYLRIERTTCARIPTVYGEFQLCHYQNTLDDKEHLALVAGDLGKGEDVLVRVHSECFTGDVLGSLRCDCGPQLDRAMQLIAQEERGVIVYLRQEGRNIGLLDKLRAYNLQDEGYDTVDANLMLGHQADNRNYSAAALILQDLGVQSVRLLTNNPSKIEGLSAYGIKVAARVALQEGVNQENIGYLTTKARRMRHLLELEVAAATAPSLNGQHGRPRVTVTYAQSLDGSIGTAAGETAALSGDQALVMTHQLRAEHDAILVGIGTVLADDPQLSTRLVSGPSPQPIILDSTLRMPLRARLLQGARPPWIATLAGAPGARKEALEQAGARILALPEGPGGRVSLTALLDRLGHEGLGSLMVEGGAEVITAFLSQGLADQLVVTIAPAILGGKRPFAAAAPSQSSLALPALYAPRYHQLGQDIILVADLHP